MSDESREERLKRKSTFVVSKEHSEMIINLLDGDYESLGRLFDALIRLNVDGEDVLSDNVDGKSREAFAWKLLKSDAEHFIESWLGKSEQNSKNRRGLDDGEEITLAELEDYCNAKGYDIQTAKGWMIQQADNGWKDENGKPIRYWKKVLDAYMRGVNKKRLANIQNQFKL